MLAEQRSIAELRQFMEQFYNKSGGHAEDVSMLSDAEVLNMAKNLAPGVIRSRPRVRRRFGKEIRGMLKLAYPDDIAAK